MPTPERIKAASREKRQRVCVICGTHFMVRAVGRVGKSCSAPCLSELRARLKRGTKQSAETVAKRSNSLKAVRSDPERNAKWTDAATQGLRRWHADPANAEAFATLSSERMKRRHTDPEWQKVRDARSSRTLKAVWETHREQFIAASIDRYARGIGLNSEEANAKRDEAHRWIMKKAQEALHTETDYNLVFADAQARLRREMPYDGPLEGSDYMEYLGKIGRATASSPECRQLSDTFMSEALPRFAAEWRRRKAVA